MDLKCLSLNCWGLKYVARKREERCRAIGDALAQAHGTTTNTTTTASTGRWDIIALQEIWVFADYEGIRRKVVHLYPYGKYYFSAALGAGLAILSRYPIVEASYTPYLMGGRPIEVLDGDWFVGKGIASALLRVTGPRGLEVVEVLNTHMHAAGGEGAGEHNLTHRLCQAWQISRAIRASLERGRHVIALGDFNSTPGSLVHTLLLKYAGTKDAWLESHGPTSALARTTPEQSILDNGVTCDSPLNTWTAGKDLDSNAKALYGKRLDYVFYASSRHTAAIGSELRCLYSKVVFTEKCRYGFSFSDHYGLEATFELVKREILPGSAPTMSHDPLDPNTSELEPEIVSRVLELGQQYYRQVQEESKRLLSFTALCALTLVVLVIGWSFQPLAYLNWIAVIISALAGGLGWTAFLLGWLGNQWETRRLREFIEEMEIHLHWSRGGSPGS